MLQQSQTAFAQMIFSPRVCVTEVKQGAIHITHRGKAVGHVSKFLTKLTLFFLKNGGKLHITATGPRNYSVDLKQGGLELPVDFCFTSLSKKLFLQIKEKPLQKYQQQKKEVEQKKKRKGKRNRKSKIKNEKNEKNM